MVKPIDRPRFRLVSDALNSEGGFADGTHLVQYPRESVKKFAARRGVAWYASDLRPACEKFVGYLSKKPATRQIENELLRRFSDDCDWRGNSLDVFISSFAIDAKARGTMLVLVDMPKVVEGNAGEQIENRVFPYLVPLAPELVLGFGLDPRGRVEWVEIDSTAVHNGAVVAVVRRWDSVGWSVKQGESVLESGDHPLGVCPVVAFSETGEFPAFGSFSEIAALSKRLFNLRSELDEILRGQTFSLLTYHVIPDMAGTIDGKPLGEGVGVNNVLMYHGERPGFVAPPDGPARVYQDQIAALESRIREIALTVDPATASKKVESGVALAIKFQALNAALSSFAMRLEDFERRVFDLAARWLALTGTTVAIDYPRDFAIADLEAEIALLQNYQAAAMPDEVVAAKKRQIIALDFATASPDELTALLDSVDQTLHERKAGAVDPAATDTANLDGVVE
jgi:hypothetical protein